MSLKLLAALESFKISLIIVRIVSAHAQLELLVSAVDAGKREMCV